MNTQKIAAVDFCQPFKALQINTSYKQRRRMQKANAPVPHGHFYPGEDWYKHLVLFFSNRYCKKIFHSNVDCFMKPLHKNGKSGQEIHEICRAFRHLHNMPIRMIINAYFQHVKKQITADAAREVLHNALNLEISEYSRISKRQDQKKLRFLAKNDQAKNCLHQALLNLKEKVWVLEWCGEWKNILMFWDYDYGPGHLLVKRIKNNLRPVYFTHSFFPIHLNGRFEASDAQGDDYYLKHLQNEDLAKIIEHAWLGTLDEIFRYNVPSLREKCTVEVEDEKKFDAKIQLIRKQWVNEDKSFCRANPTETYRWASAYNAAMLQCNPFRQILIQYDPDYYARWEDKLEGQRDDTYDDINGADAAAQKWAQNQAEAAANEAEHNRWDAAYCSLSHAADTAALDFTPHFKSALLNYGGPNSPQTQQTTEMTAIK